MRERKTIVRNAYCDVDEVRAARLAQRFRKEFAGRKPGDPVIFTQDSALVPAIACWWTQAGTVVAYVEHRRS